MFIPVIGMEAGNGPAPNAPLVDPMNQGQGQVNWNKQPPPEQVVAVENENQAAAEEAIIMQRRVAVTTDMWTASNQRKGYMTVTAHYIDNGWCLRSQLLRFIYVPTPHTSDRLAKYLVE
ncbi:Putative AC transposase [Linum perenne]